jgi:hypothetical protein
VALGLLQTFLLTAGQSNSVANLERFPHSILADRSCHPRLPLLSCAARAAKKSGSHLLVLPCRPAPRANYAARRVGIGTVSVGDITIVRLRPSHPPNKAVMKPSSTPPKIRSESPEIIVAVACAIGPAFA